MSSRLGLFALFLSCGFLIFGASFFILGDIGTIYRIGIFILFLLSAALLYRNGRLKKYFPIAYSFSIVSFVYFLEYFLYLNQKSFYWISNSRMDLYVFFKLLSTLLVVIPIILMTKASGSDMASIYLAKGNLQKGLIIGLATFLVFLVTSVQTATLLYGGRNLTFGNVISWAPWILAFVFSNGLKEELQYRGLFLKKYEPFLGAKMSNVMQAIIFTLPHLGETYSPVLLVFIVIVFLLGLAFGTIMQKTNSLLGSVLFHAGTDIPVILGIFSSL